MARRIEFGLHLTTPTSRRCPEYSRKGRCRVKLQRLAKVSDPPETKKFLQIMNAIAALHRLKEEPLYIQTLTHREIHPETTTVLDVLKQRHTWNNF